MIGMIQRHFIYRPARASELPPEYAGLPAGRVQSVCVATHDGLELRGWHVRPNEGESAATGQVILFFPGNAAHRGYRSGELELLSGLGANVFLFDYRGYGDNPGKPRERHIVSDARAIWRFLIDERQTSPGQVVLLGESLGGGVATRLAAELCEQGNRPAGLILRSTFSTLPDAASWIVPWFPVRWFMLERYLSTTHITRVSCPILSIHGNRDTVVPLRLGQQLFDAAPEVSMAGQEKKLVILPEAGHNNVLHVSRESYRHAVAEFLQDLQRNAD